MLRAWLVQLPRWYVALATIVTVLAVLILFWHLADCVGEYGVSVEKRKDEIVVELGPKAMTPQPPPCTCRSCH
jgi:hypothetical protein